ncbi:MAG: hypothetical protein M1837_004119 [Sclerophora amabilis]|nr:MAG: hypothetical protein M1837_004119 [Sclerophora amabilis]
MAILLTGGAGKTSSRVARFLQDAQIPFLVASRKGEAGAPPGMPATKFDWLDSATFENPFQHQFPGGERIAAVYLVAPPVPDPVPPMKAFVDFAIEKHGVKRFVLLTGTSDEKGGGYTGKLWQYFIDIGVEYCVLQATWFMENLVEAQFIGTLRDEGKLYTATEDGKIPFVSATDIAAAAFRALIDTKPHNTDHQILGPELLTYDDIAAKLSSGLGRDIVHVKLSEEENTQRLIRSGMPEHYGKLLSSLEARSARGGEDRLNDTVERVTGRPPQTFDSWVQENKTAWQ